MLRRMMTDCEKCQRITEQLVTRTERSMDDEIQWYQTRCSVCGTENFPTP